MYTCYSIDDENFSLLSIGDVLDALNNEGRLKEGEAYFEASFRQMQGRDVFSVEHLLESMGERLYDEVGDFANDYPSVTPEAKRELETFILEWIERHARLSRYMVVIGTPLERRVTAADIAAKEE